MHGYKTTCRRNVCRWRQRQRALILSLAFARPPAPSFARSHALASHPVGATKFMLLAYEHLPFSLM